MRKLFCLMTLLALSACSAPASSPTSGLLSVVATTSIIGDVARQVGGSHVNVQVLLPAGSDPHAYEPRPQDVLVHGRVPFWVMVRIASRLCAGVSPPGWPAAGAGGSCSAAPPSARVDCSGAGGGGVLVCGRARVTSSNRVGSRVRSRS